MKPKSVVAGLPVYQPGKPMEQVKQELGLTEVTKLASNENPYGCSPKVRDAIIAEIDNTHMYPDGGSARLRAALAQELGVSGDQLIFGAGSDDVILMLARAYLVAGDESIMADITFPQYKHNVEIEGAHAVEVPLKNGTHDLEAMLARITERTKIIWVCNPNNPTGTRVTHEEIANFLKRVPAHVIVALDEAYVEYAEGVDPDFPDGLSLLPQYPNLILLRTFSKIYGLASLRIGYGIGHRELIAMVNQVREPFNTTRYAQSAALAALGDKAFLKECRRKNKEGIDFLTAAFTRMGLASYPAYGNFIMVDTKRPGKQVFEAVLRKGVIVRFDPGWKSPTHIRVTVGSREQNELFLAALQEVLQSVAVEA